MYTDTVLLKSEIPEMLFAYPLLIKTHQLVRPFGVLGEGRPVQIRDNFITCK